ncbi:MAG: lipopolysaccharide biosynthesis protein RfbH [Thaumarchaeota archaeon]|nr:lipopolysaccharide biosynthesis protein RfbH [Candidatus Nitrosopelagicus sp.]MBT6647574.1 lipopolysaccharide biosynthesis protein RfbH [Nitrososphaerota archaeon]
MVIEDFLKNNSLDNSEGELIRKQILDLSKQYSEKIHSVQEFVPGKNIVPVSGKVFDFFDLQSLISSSLDFWLTTGRFNGEFEKQLSKFVDINFALTTNSGSSANLLAISSLMSGELGERKLNPGDEVITLAAGFPTTVNPIFQNNLIPKFIDIDLPTYSASPKNIESAITSKTKAIIFAHTLGNPFELDTVLDIVKKNNLWLIEDCCDALGSTYKNKHVGTFGDVATFSFYPAHQITMGEGGAVITDNPLLRRIIESLRDWGRDCFCAPGKNNTCKKRFDWQLGELPFGYDHKYTYSNTGYNLKITDMQASVGLSQLQKLPEFIKKRQENFEYLKVNLSKFSKYFILPTATLNSSPSWFGFPIVVIPDSPFSKNDLIEFLSSKLIDTRPLFAGNLTKQPYLKNKNYKTFGTLENTDLVMNNGFWIGVFPGLTQEMLQYVVEEFKNFINLFE